MSDKRPACLLVLSGGQDSTTCGFWAREFFGDLHAVTFHYGQRHAIEIEAAIKVAELIGVKSHKIKHIGQILDGTSPLVSDQPLEQYKDKDSLPGGLEKTFVPGRNLLFMTLAANMAYCMGISHIVLGVCQEDFGGYPDCRDEFVKLAQQTIRRGFAMPGEFFSLATIHTPLMHLTKAQSVELAMNMSGCYEALAYTHTSYDGQYPPVGKDHATLLREKGFAEAGVADPLVLRAWGEGLMALPLTDNYARYREAV